MKIYEKLNVYDAYNIILEKIKDGRNIDLIDIQKIKDKNIYPNQDFKYFIKEIFKIENNLENFDIEKRKDILRNCTRCIYWIDSHAEEYRKIIINKSIYIENLSEENIRIENNKLNDTRYEKKENVNEIYHYDNNKKYGLQKGNMFSITNNIIGNIYSDNVVLSSSKGHGYAAEKANNLYDNIVGKDAKIIGSDLKKNGADRLVNGIQIQTKYCESGTRCVSECFENGKFRYVNSDGTPMKIEVPSDKYEEAINAMKNRIKRGEIPGVVDIDEAGNIVKKGQFTYEQAKNIAKFGKIESITYDAINGVKVMGTAFGISSLLTFACSLWNGEDINNAFKQSLEAGFKVGGISWISGIITSQLGRTGLETGLRPFTDFIVKNMDKNTLNSLVNGLGYSERIIAGSAAANNLSKIFRGNIITTSVSAAVLSFVDINRLIKGEISGNQAFKNITTSTSGVVGGSIGYIGGVALGATIGSVIPVIGTAVGGTIGGVLGGISGGTIVSKTTKNALDNFIEDDSKKMIDILLEQLEKVSFNYLLNEGEIKRIIDNISHKNLEEIVRIMYSSSKRVTYIYGILEESAIKEIKNRKYVINPFK